MRIILTCLLFLLGSAQLTQAQNWDAVIAAFSDDGGSTKAELDTMNAEDSLELAELAFRNLFANNKMVKPRKSKYYIISFLHCARHMYIDPDGPFMASLQDVRPKVKKTSFYYRKEKKLYDKVVYFFITEMIQINDNTAVIKGGYYQDDEHCAGHKYYMKRVDGYWEIERVSVEWAL
ncbi:MAG: hypothetical protein ACPGLV_16250 [Bacteroidia bacterium]